MNKEDSESSWFVRLKQFLQVEPQNKEQLINLLRDAHDRALIDSETLAMIEGTILFAQLKVRDIMLPKKQMTCIAQDAELSDVIKTVSQSGHSRFPVTGDSTDEIIGILHAKDLLRYQALNTPSFNLPDIVRHTTFIPEGMRLDLLLSEFRVNRNHMAIVVDEYGSVTGFVTLEDIIEQIIGDIEDEFDIDEEAYIKAHSNTHFIIKAHTPIDEFNAQLNADFNDEVYDTIGGIIMSHLGHLPKRGETVTINQFEFRIINADARRIKLLECFKRSEKKQPQASSNEDAL